MKLVLLKNVKGIGKAGDVKNVSDGYAGNFLIPNKLAQKATKENIKKAEETAREAKKTEELALAEMQKTADGLKGKEFKISAKTQNSSEKLFGSIDKKQIIEKLTAEKYQLDKATIALDKPIKQLGEYPVEICFAQGISAMIKIIIEKA